MDAIYRGEAALTACRAPLHDESSSRDRGG